MHLAAIGHAWVQIDHGEIACRILRIKASPHVPLGLIRATACSIRSWRATEQSIGIDQRKRIEARVNVGVDAAVQAHRIALAIAPEHWVVAVAEVVVMLPRLLVGVLARESERELERTKPRGVFIRWIAAERFCVVVLPNRRTGSVSYKSGCVEVIGVTI